MEKVAVGELAGPSAPPSALLPLPRPSKLAAAGMTASAAHPFAGSHRRSGSTSCIRSVWHRDHRAADREQARTKPDSPMTHARPHRRSRPSRRLPLRGGRSHDRLRNIDGGLVSLAQFLERDGALVPRGPDRAARPSPTHRQTCICCIRKRSPRDRRESSIAPYGRLSLRTLASRPPTGSE